MPSVSDRQANFMAAEYGRAKRGQKTQTGMSRTKLREWVKSDVQKKARRDAARSMMNGGE